MSRLDLMRLFEQFEGEVSESDFSVEELEELLSYTPDEMQAFKERYFAKYNDTKSPSLKKQDW